MLYIYIYQLFIRFWRDQRINVHFIINKQISDIYCSSLCVRYGVHVISSWSFPENFCNMNLFCCYIHQVSHVLRECSFRSKMIILCILSRFSEHACVCCMYMYIIKLICILILHYLLCRTYSWEQCCRSICIWIVQWSISFKYFMF